MKGNKKSTLVILKSNLEFRSFQWINEVWLLLCQLLSIKIKFIKNGLYNLKQVVHNASLDNTFLFSLLLLIQVIEGWIDAPNQGLDHIIAKREGKRRALGSLDLFPLAPVVVNNIQIVQFTVPFVQIAHSLIVICTGHYGCVYTWTPSEKTLLELWNSCTSYISF